MFPRRLAELGAHVVAFDFSPSFLDRARARTQDFTDRIEYRLVDAMNQQELLDLGIDRYDAAVCTMALMDMASIDSLISALSQLLRRGGRFVFSVPHPCFNNSSVTKVVEEIDTGGKLVTTYAVKVPRYIRSSVGQGVGAVGEPIPHLYFHRPLHELFDICFRASFVLDGLEEPVFETKPEPTRPLSWVNYAEIPPVLVARLRRL